MTNPIRDPLVGRAPTVPGGEAPGPAHVAIIMDGNGRWARARGLPRVAGHRRGVEALRATVRAAPELGIQTLTLYSFSQENWSRPASEVSDLMNLLRGFVRQDLNELVRAGVRIRVVGERDGLVPDIRDLIEQSEAKTLGNDRLTLVVAFNYGARQEIAAAARSLAAEAAAGRLNAASITPELFERHLLTAGVPDPDLIIRTSGEQRLSNFLLWQAAYAEFVFLPIFWPDFDRAALEGAIAQFRGRDRRFGGLAGRGAT